MKKEMLMQLGVGMFLHNPSKRVIRKEWDGRTTSWNIYRNARLSYYFAVDFDTLEEAVQFLNDLSSKK